MKCFFSSCKAPVAYRVVRLWCVKGKPLPVMYSCKEHMPGSRCNLGTTPAAPVGTLKYYRVEPLSTEVKE